MVVHGVTGSADVIRKVLIDHADPKKRTDFSAVACGRGPDHCDTATAPGDHDGLTALSPIEQRRERSACLGGRDGTHDHQII